MSQLIQTQDITWDNLGDAFSNDYKPKMEFPPAKLAYVKEPGITPLSFSKLAILKDCPRKFSLSELESQREFSPTAHTAFGHSFGAGVQLYLQYASQDSSPEGIQKAKHVSLCAVLAYWDTYDINDSDQAGIKTIWQAVQAMRVFWIEAEEILAKYKVHSFILPDGTSKPAVELLFYVNITEKYSYQGHIDLVLEDLETGALCVVEIKTRSNSADRSDYANSSQTMGYCVALQAYYNNTDILVEQRTLYIVYNAKDMTIQLFEFHRNLDVGMEWISSLMLDIAILELYDEHGFYPKNGANCKKFNRQCEYFGTCDLSSRIVDNPSYESVGTDKIDIRIDAETLLELAS